MTVWIMGILGVICLSVLVDILLPDGQTNKYIKGIFSLITLYVIISPFPTLLSKEYDLNNMFNFQSAEIEIDESFLEGVSSNPFSISEKTLAVYLEKNGYQDVQVKYIGRVENSAEIDYINVYLTKALLPNNFEHMVVTENVKCLASDFSGVNKEDIRVLYG